MFERFAADARAVVVGAQEVARRGGATAIDSGHLLASLAGQPDSPAARALVARGVPLAALTSPDELDAQALASLGIDLAAVSARADEVFGPGALTGAARPRRTGHIPFSREAKKTLEIALREAIRLGEKTIEDRHLLLAVIRLRDSIAHDRLEVALRAAGSDAAALRAALEGPRGASGSGPEPHRVAS